VRIDGAARAFRTIEQRWEIRTRCLTSASRKLLRWGLLRFESAVKERSAGVVLAGAGLLAPSRESLAGYDVAT
jgi:hypothetical protein